MRNSGVTSKGVTIWMTGLSGAGKSTTGKALENWLSAREVPVVVLDGDELRTGLNRDLGYSLQDRSENVRRTAEVARLFNNAGFLSIVTLISPLSENRDEARKIHGDLPFYEIYIQCTLEKCEERDPKGLYKKARTGELPDFTGVSSPYDRPNCPDLTLNTAETELADSVELITNFMKRKGHF